MTAHVQHSMAAESFLRPSTDRTRKASSPSGRRKRTQGRECETLSYSNKHQESFVPELCLRDWVAHEGFRGDHQI